MAVETRAAVPVRRHWRLTPMPALDGLRGLAVAGVVLYHFGYLRGGYLGVDLFFVLSGFLITSLLLTEQAASATVALGGFWARRARRLLPALYLLLFGVIVYCLVWARPIDLGQIRGDGFAALLYVSNWRNILASTDYWAISKAPSPLQHLWSLAIEEQFYLVWPLVVLALTRHRHGPAPARRVLQGALVGAGLSLAMFAYLRVTGASDTRIYEGTDTRAFAILLGAALAAWLRLLAVQPDGGGAAEEGRPVAAAPDPRTTWLVAAGPAAAVVLGIAWLALSGRSPILYNGGLPACSALATIVLAATILPGGGIAGLHRVLLAEPVRLLGRISYSLYLWHWPVYLVVNEVRTGLDGVVLLGVRLAISVALAVFSFVVVEQPIRQGALRGPWAAGSIPAAMAAIAVLLVAVTADAVSVSDVNATNARTAPVATVASAPRVLYLGDSVAGSVADLAAGNPKGYGINAYSGAKIGCGITYEGNEVQGQAGDVSRPPSCTPTWPGIAAQVKPKVVGVLFGASPVPKVRIDGTFRDACDPAYRSLLAQRLTQQVTVLGQGGVRVALITNPPTTNPFRPPEADRMAGCWNEVLAQVARDTPAELVDLAGFVCPDGACQDSFDGAPTRPDSVHFNGPGGAVPARWLAQQLAALAPG